jgi:hypothetical protein
MFAGSQQRGEQLVLPPQWLVGFLVAIMLVIHGILLAWEAYGDCPSYDEVAHLPAGIRCWEKGRFDLYRVNPPLARFVSALPVWLSQPRTSYKSVRGAPYHRSEFEVATDFMDLNGDRALTLYRLGRLACIPFSFLGAWICFVWGRALYGSLAGLLAMALWCFDPLVLGHGHLITCDVAGAATAVAAAYTFWLWLRQPHWPNALWAGLILGLAQLAKTTNLLLLGVWPCVWLLWRLIPSPAPRPRWASEGLQMAAGFLTALAVLNAGYGFEGSFTSLGDYSFVSKALCGANSTSSNKAVYWNRFRGTWLGNVPVPLPINYLCGIDLQRSELEEQLIVSQLRGVVRRGGWWYYYFYALLVKEPLGTLALFALATIVPWFFPRPPGAGRDELMLLLPPFALFLALCTQTGFTCHARYALPVLPFAFILIGRLIPPAATSRLLGFIVFACVLATVVSSLRVCPHSLSYFNEAAGGPENGPAHLLDSNIDWGQDLLYLRQWLDGHPEARPLGLAYHGTFDPKLVLADFEYVPQGPRKETTDTADVGPQPGWYAVSVQFVFGGSDAPDPDYPDRHYIYFRHFTPIARAGYSIWIYHLRPEEVDRVREAIGLPPLAPP